MATCIDDGAPCGQGGYCDNCPTVSEGDQDDWEPNEKARFKLANYQAHKYSASPLGDRMLLEREGSLSVLLDKLGNQWQLQPVV